MYGGKKWPSDRMASANPFPSKHSIQEALTCKVNMLESHVLSTSFCQQRHEEILSVDDSNNSAFGGNETSENSLY